MVDLADVMTGENGQTMDGGSANNVFADNVSSKNPQ
jgi:hypothetical protein